MQQATKLPLQSSPYSIEIVLHVNADWIGLGWGVGGWGGGGGSMQSTGHFPHVGGVLKVKAHRGQG